MTAQANHILMIEDEPDLILLNVMMPGMDEPIQFSDTISKI